MKIEEAKARSLFMAQYVWQIIYFPEGHKFDNPLMLAPLDLDYRKIEFGDHLLLRSIEQLTDEEKITIASIVCQRHNRHYDPSDISYRVHTKNKLEIILLVDNLERYIIQITPDGIAYTSYRMGGAGREDLYCPGQYAATDYLRSIGILLPFTYLGEDNKPVTLSPEEILKLDWAKIKTN